MEPETGLFTVVQMRPGCGPEHHEAAVALELLTDETGPLAVLGDSAYGGAAIRTDLTAAGHDLLLRGAMPSGPTMDDVVIDTAPGTATCPAGQTATIGNLGKRTTPPLSRPGAVPARCGPDAPKPATDAI